MGSSFDRIGEAQRSVIGFNAGVEESNLARQAAERNFRYEAAARDRARQDKLAQQATEEGYQQQVRQDALDANQQKLAYSLDDRSYDRSKDALKYGLDVRQQNLAEKTEGDRYSDYNYNKIYDTAKGYADHLEEVPKDILDKLKPEHRDYLTGVIKQKKSDKQLALAQRAFENGVRIPTAADLPDVPADERQNALDVFNTKSQHALETYDADTRQAEDLNRAIKAETKNQLRSTPYRDLPDEQVPIDAKLLARDKAIRLVRIQRSPNMKYYVLTDSGIEQRERPMWGRQGATGTSTANSGGGETQTFNSEDSARASGKQAGDIITITGIGKVRLK